MASSYWRIAVEAYARGLEGAMAAQDERERRAGERCGVPYELSGCDWPDAVAERLLEALSEVERLRTELTMRSAPGRKP